jgi:hypothetical protein
VLWCVGREASAPSLEGTTRGDVVGRWGGLSLVHDAASCADMTARGPPRASPAFLTVPLCVLCMSAVSTPGFEEAPPTAFTGDHSLTLYCTCIFFAPPCLPVWDASTSPCLLL